MGDAPFLGENNAEILKRYLGYSKREITRLYNEKVLYKEEAVDRLPGELIRLGIK